MTTKFSISQIYYSKVNGVSKQNTKPNEIGKMK